MHDRGVVKATGRHVLLLGALVGRYAQTVGNRTPGFPFIQPDIQGDMSASRTR